MVIYYLYFIAFIKYYFYFCTYNNIVLSTIEGPVSFENFNMYILFEYRLCKRNKDMPNDTICLLPKTVSDFVCVSNSIVGIHCDCMLTMKSAFQRGAYFLTAIYRSFSCASLASWVKSRIRRLRL